MLNMNQVLRALKTAAIAMALMAAETGAQQAPPQESKGATIHGVLIDALLGGRADAMVTLQDTSRRTIKQMYSLKGEYRITDIPDGHYFLHVQSNMYAPQDYGQFTPDSPPMELILTRDASYELSFTLERAGSISGRLADFEGRPVGSAEVQLLVVRYDTSGNRFLVAPANVAASRATSGIYSFAGVPPGEYYVRATITLPADRNTRAPVHHNIRTYYPGAEDPEQAVMVEMPKASKTIANTNFFFKEVSPFKVTGKIVYPPQTNIKSPLYIYLVPKNNPFARLIDPPLPLVDFDEAQQTFELRNVQRGSYDLYIAAITDYAPNAEGAPNSPGFSAQIPVEVRDADVTGLVAELEPGVDLHGEFKLDGSIEATRVTLGRSQPVFIPQDGKPWALAPGASVNANTFVQPNGTFDLVHAATGRYRIGAVIPEGLYVSNAWLGPRNIMGQPFEIERRTEGPLSLELSSDGARFEGTVTDVNNSPANALVVLVPPTEFRNDPGVSKTARTDKAGHFVISGIRPGMYTAYAFPRIENNAWLNDDFMNFYRALGLQINFGKGTQVYRDFKSVPMPK